MNPRLATIVSLLCVLVSCTPAATTKETPMFALTDAQRARLQRALEPLHAQYDPQEKMVRRPFSSPGYHTKLTGGFVHPTREALHYAVALLDTGDDALRARAEEVLRRVIALQDKDPASRTYGIWSWFLEEPLAKMSPPDWNWADFCGVQLLQVALDHRQRLPADLMAQVDDAIKHAARSIERRNVGPGYTNIAIMGTYVTLVAAETYDMPDLRRYAMERLKRFHDYTRRQGAFTEYNSPTYTIVALTELARMLRHVKDPGALRLIEDLHRTAWEEIAQHFHPPTLQWAGPHSRCYNTLLPASVLALIERATEGRVHFAETLRAAGFTDERLLPSLDEARVAIVCPRDFEPFFTTLDRPRTVEKTFVKGERAPEPPPLGTGGALDAIAGTTYLTPDYALGSVNRGDLWNQRRALLAYWGSPAKPAYLHLRFLHDGYDFAAAQFFSVQKDGRVLAGINLALNGGDRHVSLDRIKDATIKAKDLRLRFEFGGAAAALTCAVPDKPGAPAVLQAGTLRVEMAVPYARFGPNAGTWETNKDGGKLNLDLVLHRTEDAVALKLNDLERAVVGVAVRLAATETPFPPVAAAVSEGRLAMVWDGLELSLSVKPAKIAELQSGCKAARK